MKELDLKTRLIVAQYAQESGDKIKRYVASGLNGHVFETEHGFALKVTGDLREVHMALLSHRNKLNRCVDYYDFHKISDDEFVLKQTFLNTAGIEQWFMEFEDALEEAEWDFNFVDVRALNLSGGAKKLLKDLEGLVAEAESSGFEFTDLHDGNLGYDSNGLLRAFDQRTLNMSDAKVKKSVEVMYLEFEPHKRECVSLKNRSEVKLVR
ncbi:hypothetical protein [Vibrio sp. D431a]|uniref:hypothetical protein n=1 Tax=Vibrio sp. D431a TaxID=2837388 RepID=UPI0025562E77|nr:hypothetical protein [Vibrio sp. D431a]MDK9789948.1 hypothetical protein [Vibrio sp. D431a]